jgi:cold shock CspA family protein/ribosome-associated translation inhibitor RaiA
MQIPIHLSGKGVVLSPNQEAQVRREVAGLERFFDRLVACRVVVSLPHHRPGGEPVDWSIRLSLTMPGSELSITRQPKPSFKEALEDAFGAARRQLQDHARQLRGDVKAHATEPRGRVTRLFGYEGYGFITTEDGHEIYFDRHSVPRGGFERLELGTMVRFVEQAGEKGPQASMVVPVDGTGWVPSSPQGGGTWR